MATATPRNPVTRAFIQFSKVEAAGGIVMLAATTAALLIANSWWNDAYQEFLHTYIGFLVGDFTLNMSLLHWVNDGLMAVFFFVVGLEIKREVLFGELSSIRRASLPILAAVGGAVIPALIYVWFNRSGPYMHGWGIPMATDIAFAVGIMSLLGSRAPLWLRSFVTALAIADDIIAVLIIAVFYSAGIQTEYLLWAAGVLLVMIVMNRKGVQWTPAYMIPAIVLWYLVYQSGIHATIAGVAAALTIPASQKSTPDPEEIQDLEASMAMLTAATSVEESLSGARGLEAEEALEAKDAREAALDEIKDAATEQSALLYRLEHSLHTWVSFGILPLFAFVNAGIVIPFGTLAQALATPVVLGITLGLFVGKQVGITVITWLAVKLGLGDLPAGATWRQLWGGALFAGIGFTMSIFIANLAFTSPESLELAKIGVLGGSLASAIVGVIVLRSVPIDDAAGD
jgi:NhaA family Na+:H+ antiporter